MSGTGMNVAPYVPSDPAKQIKWLDELTQWERKFHKEVLEWIAHRSRASEGCEILDFSMDSAIFGQLLAAKLGAKRIVAAKRTVDQPQIHPVKPQDGEKINLEEVNVDISGTSFESLAELGQFDVILLKEMLYGFQDLSLFFQGLKSCLKDETRSSIFILTRPKNPPVPIPDEALGVWRKLAPGRDEIIAAATTPLPSNRKMRNWDWVLRFCPKATDKVIRDFIDSRNAKLVFEEKILAIVLFQGEEKVVEHELVANRDELE